MKAETRKKILVRDFYTCQKCGKSGSTQVAHRIHKGKESNRYIKNFVYNHYGIELTRAFVDEAILNHPDNLALACSLSCNDSFNIFYKPVQRDILIQQIYEKVRLFFNR